VIRPTWRRWLTREELDDLGKIVNYYDEDGTWTGASLGVTISPVRVREHTARSRRRDERWAARRGYVVDAQGIIRAHLPDP
jgi:hypothetical protein